MDDDVLARAAGDARVYPGPSPSAERVLLVVEQLRREVPGGIGTYIRGLLQGLAELEADHADLPVVALHASRAPRGPDPVATFGRPFHLSRLPSVLLTRAWDRGLVHAPDGYGVVHATSLAAPPVKRAPTIVTIHDVAWRRVPDAYPRRGRRWHEASLRRAVRRARRLIVPSSGVAADLRHDLPAAGAPVPEVSVIPHGSDHLPAPDEEGVARLLRRMGVSAPYLLSVGTLEPRKNLRRAFQAYGIARAAMPEPWPLVVVGPNGWGPDLPVRPGVFFTGPVTPGVLAGLYASARLLVYVPLTEGFGLPPVEAMRAGTPVVASPLPSTDGDGAALEVDPLEVESVAGGIVKAAVDDELRRALVARGTERAAALTWRASAMAHVEVWGAVR